MLLLTSLMWIQAGFTNFIIGITLILTLVAANPCTPPTGSTKLLLNTQWPDSTGHYRMILRGETEVLEENLSRWYVVHHNMGWPGMEPGSRRKAGDQPPEQRHGQTVTNHLKYGTARITLSGYIIWQCNSHLSLCTLRARMTTSQYISRLYCTVTWHSASVCCRIHTDSGENCVS